MRIGLAVVILVAIGEKDSSHGRTKHIDTQYHFIREKIADRTLRFEWISTHKQVADILTKSLPSRIFLRFQSQLVFPTSHSSTQNELNEEEKSNESTNTHSQKGVTTTHMRHESDVQVERE